MAGLLWGRVYYNELFAGYLQEEPGERASFTYDESYLNGGFPQISHTLPLRPEPFITSAGLHPFFDNLVAEGWLEEAQTRLLGKRQATRFELLLAFGQDCAGAVSIVDAEPARLTTALANISDPIEMAVMQSRASLSGIQPKLTIIEREGKFYPSNIGEVSTHIAKFPSRHHDDLVINEYLTTRAFKALLPEDTIVDFWIGNIEGFSEPALIIKRFDRTTDNNKRIHFEEFNQLLGHSSRAKYDGTYKDMADFIRNTENCLPVEIYRLFLRILAGLLVGNTDMHLKNLAMLYTSEGLRLAPVYDQVAAVLYQYKTIALAIGGARDLLLGNLKERNIIKLAEEFQLSKGALKMAYGKLLQNEETAKEAIASAQTGSENFKRQLIDLMERRWNGTFALIGQGL